MLAHQNHCGFIKTAYGAYIRSIHQVCRNELDTFQHISRNDHSYDYGLAVCFQILETEFNPMWLY